MYEEYMQNFFNYPVNGYKNTYDVCENQNYGINYEPRCEFGMAQNYPYSCNNFNYIQNGMPKFQNRNAAQDLEDYYPEIYKIVYPMVRKVCFQNNRGYGKDAIDRMVEEVYSSIEVNDALELNITLNNDVRGNGKSKDDESKSEILDDSKDEKRQIRRNSGLNDLIRILILRELLGRPGCIGPNCRPGPRPPMPPRPPFPRGNIGVEYNYFE